MNKKIIAGCAIAGSIALVAIGLNQSSVHAFMYSKEVVTTPQLRTNNKAEQLKKITFDELTTYEGNFAFIDLPFGGLDGKGNFFRLLNLDTITYGYINESNGTFIEPNYSSVNYASHDPFANGVEPFMKDGKWGYINEDSETVIAFIYEEANKFYNDLALVKYKGKYGYIDTKGAFIKEPAYIEAQDFYLKDITVASTADEKQVLINRQGEELYKADHIDLQENNYIIFTIGEKQGIGKYNNGFKVIVEPSERSYYMDRNQEDIVFVYHDMKSYEEGYIDGTGKEIPITDTQHETKLVNGLYYTHTDDNGISMVMNQEGKTGIAKGEQVIIQPLYDFVEPFDNNDYAKVGKLDIKTGRPNMGLIDMEGNYVIEPNYQVVEQDYEDTGIYYVYDDKNKMSFYNDETKTLYKEKYDHIYRYKEGFIYMTNNKSGYMDTEGKDIISAYKDFLPEEHEKGYIKGYDDGQMYITHMESKKKVKLDKTIISVDGINDYGYRISRGLNLKGLLDKEGNEILPCIFDSIAFISKDKVRVIFTETQEMKMGIITLSQK